MMTESISIKDIAKRANTSITTVSFVINGRAKEKNISKEVTAKVLSLVDELGFRPNLFARGLRTGKSHTICFLVDDISDPFYSGIARFIEEKAALNGYKILLSSIRNRKNSIRELIGIFNERRVDGFIIAAPVGMEEEVKCLIDSQAPVVLFDHYLPAIQADYVLVDNYMSTYNATNHLIQNGYHNCAFITTGIHQQKMIDRGEGYKKAVSERNCEELILELSYHGPGSMVRGIGEFLAGPHHIDAVIFGANYITMEGLRSLKNPGNQLRDDIALVSFDDFELLEFISPPMTAIVQPLEDIAEQIIELLVAKLDRESGVFSTINIPCSLNVRESSAARL